MIGLLTLVNQLQPQPKARVQVTQVLPPTISGEEYYIKLGSLAKGVLDHDFKFLAGQGIPLKFSYLTSIPGTDICTSLRTLQIQFTSTTKLQNIEKIPTYYSKDTTPVE